MNNLGELLIKKNHLKIKLRYLNFMYRIPRDMSIANKKNIHLLNKHWLKNQIDKKVFYKDNIEHLYPPQDKRYKKSMKRAYPYIVRGFCGARVIYFYRHIYLKRQKRQFNEFIDLKFKFNGNIHFKDIFYIHLINIKNIPKKEENLGMFNILIKNHVEKEKKNL